MSVTMYTQDDVDAMLAGMYSRDEVDAFIQGLQNQISGIKNPPVIPAGKIIGSGDMQAFRGMRLSGHRTYNGFGVGRQYNPKGALALVQADLVAGRRSYQSVGFGNNKAHPKDGPQDFPDTLTGLPVDQFVPVWKVVQQTGGVAIIHHEPEDDPGTPEKFKTIFPIMSKYIKQQVPGIRVGLCLMAWTGRQGGPGFPLWTPDPASFDVFCIDGYAHQVGDTAQAIFANALAYARSLKKPLMITETGQENNVDQIPFLGSLNTFVQANADVEGFLYWNGGNGVQAKGGHNYHLTPDALGTFSQLLTTGHYAQAATAV